MKLLDLFCGAGGAAMGYHRAGFEVVGVDIEPQPNYPFEFHRGGGLAWLEHFICEGEWPNGQDFDAIHASPPCQAYSVANNIHGRDDHPWLVEPLVPLLEQAGLPYVVENVEGSPLRESVTICGLAEGLGVKRHRLFATTFAVLVRPCPKGHPGDWVSVFGHTVLSRGKVIGKAKGGGNRIKRQHLGTDRGREAMGIDWMTRDELSEAIPPAYTELIGHQLMQHLKSREREAA